MQITMVTVANKHIVENINNGHRIEVFVKDWNNPKKWNSSLKRAYQVVDTIKVEMTPEVAALVLNNSPKKGKGKGNRSNPSGKGKNKK
jgi:hypothetical protein